MNVPQPPRGRAQAGATDPPGFTFGSFKAAQLVLLGGMKWLYASHDRLEPGLPASQMLPLAGGRMPTESWIPGSALQACMNCVAGMPPWGPGPEIVEGNEPLIGADPRVVADSAIGRSWTRTEQRLAEHRRVRVPSVIPSNPNVVPLLLFQ